MMDLQSFGSAIEQICEEKGIAKEKVIEAIEMALAAAYKKDYGHKGQNIKVKFNPANGSIKVSMIKLVVDESMLKTEEELTKEKEKGEEIKGDADKSADNIEETEKKVRFNPDKHILLEEAKKLTEFPKEILKKLKAGDELEFPMEVREDYGRIAAQTAKQVIIQRIREAERESIFSEYKEKEGQIISGIVQRIEGQNIFIDIGKTTGILFPEEQIPGERYRINQRLKVLILAIRQELREPTIILSRAHANMINQLFSLEVPEISNGAVAIKAVAREAGSRTKIAVASNDEKVDPIGSMIGQRGSRVQMVINELNGEKIDIIQWSDDPAKFISHALSPAKVSEVKIINEKNKEAVVIVPDDQLSLAIGIKGQNARLTVKLTGWKIDITIDKKEEPAKTDKKNDSANQEQKKTETASDKILKKSTKKTKKQKTSKKD